MIEFIAAFLISFSIIIVFGSVFIGGVLGMIKVADIVSDRFGLLAGAAAGLAIIAIIVSLCVSIGVVIGVDPQ